MRTITLFLSTILFTSCINVISTQKFAEGPIEERTLPITEEITAIAASNGADVIVDPTLPASEIRVTTHTDIFDILEIKTNKGTIEIGLTSNSLRAKTFEVRIPILAYKDISVSGGSDFSWDNCVAEELSIAASGGADAEISGRCITLNVAASGGADADLDELMAENVNVSASGGADVEVYATKSLTVNASGGSDVAFRGNPEKKDIERSGGADVYVND